MAINLTTTILSGLSKGAPGIDGNGLYGTVAVWADAESDGTVLMGYSGVSYAPQILNPAWTAYDSPAVAIATDWGTLFMAYTGLDGYVHLASSADGWRESTQIAGGSITAGPALAYSDGLLYIAWQTSDGQLGFATMAKGGQITGNTVPVPLSSRPTICAEDPDGIYVLCGGAFIEGPAPLTIYHSSDGGQTFTLVTTPPTMCYGPPSLAILDQFYLAWAADEQGSPLCLAQTTDLGSFTPMNYGVGCHEGGPALIPMLTFPNPNDPEDIIFSLSSGWAMGSDDPNIIHHVAIGSFGPLPITEGAAAARQRRRIDQLRAPRALEPCPDPSTVYDPATGQCVSKFGCWGRCVLSSVGPTGFFNPISYAICVARCKSAQ